jgi:hypothetical protein
MPRTREEGMERTGPGPGMERTSPGPGTERTPPGPGVERTSPRPARMVEEVDAPPLEDDDIPF